MHDESKIVGIIRSRQQAMRREMDRRGIAMKVVAQDSGIDYGTLLTYFPANGDKTPAQIPGSAIYALTGHLEPDILSLLLPEGHLIVQIAEGIDYDEVADWAEQFSARKLAAHRKDSECAEEIGPTESGELGAIVVRFPGKAAA